MRERGEKKAQGERYVRVWRVGTGVRGGGGGDLGGLARKVAESWDSRRGRWDW